jgi:hypothetical protein
MFMIPELEPGEYRLEIRGLKPKQLFRLEYKHKLTCAG